MIYESSYWKDDLLRTAKDLRRRCEQKRWTDVSIARLEQRIMIGFYSVRRLRESRKISDRFRNRPVPLLRYPPTGAAILRSNRTEIDGIYDLSSPEPTKMPLDFAANQIIHSYIFTPGFNEARLLEDLFFASDEKKESALFSIKILEIAAIFEEVGNNYPTNMTTVYDPARKREIVRVE